MVLVRYMHAVAIAIICACYFLENLNHRNLAKKAAKKTAWLMKETNKRTSEIKKKMTIPFHIGNDKTPE